MVIKVFDSEKAFGYTQKTTFYQDFSIADMFGVDAIEDTYKRAFKDWKSNIEFLTELVMVLNWKIWEHYKTNDEYGKLYDKLWREACDWCYDNLKGEDLSYFIRTTD